MSEKQFDHIENKIREAAENSEQPFDEHAWSLMEAKLNKKDRRYRFLFWLLPLGIFLVAGGGYFLFNIDKGTEKGIESQQQFSDNTIIKPGQLAKDVSLTADSGTSSVAQNAKVRTVKKSSPIISQISEADQLHNATSHKKKKPAEAFKKIKSSTKGRLTTSNSSGIAGDTEDVTTTVAGTDITNEKLLYQQADKTKWNKTAITLKDSLKQIITLKEEPVKNNPDTNVTPVKKKNEATKNKPARFYLLASLGADVGSVKLLTFNNSKITPKYGIGIGYHLNKKISLQTGFYASRKKYIAGPDDYNPKAGSYWSQVSILKVDAACLIYDIPLTIRYDIVQRPTTSYYTTAGISSFIMKREGYDYHYLRNGNYYKANSTYTGNKNFFSVFNLSAGVEKKIGRNFYIQAEPSLSIPITGVGEGKVKLYSAALQIGLKYQPLKKHK